VAFYSLFRKGREREEEKRNDKYQITMCQKIPSFGRPSSVWIHRAGKHETCWAGCEGDRVKKYKKKMEEIINKRNQNQREKIRKMEKRATRICHDGNQ
jgi:predicted ATPase